MNLPGAISSARLPERLRPLLTLVNLHYLGAALLLLLNLLLGVSIFSAWRATSDSGAEALAQQQNALTNARLQARPLEGLDAKLVTATQESDLFYARRLPVGYARVATELGGLTHAQGVKLTRVQYSPVPVLSNTPGALTEVRIDASLTGDYRPLVLFINSLERDRMFFLISGLTLTGQQSGTVGLRLRLTTYLRPAVDDSTPPPADTDDTATDLGTTPAQGAAALRSPVETAVPTRSTSAASSPQRVGLGAPPASPTTTTRPSRSQNFTPPPGGPPLIRSANPPPGGLDQ